MTQYRGSVPGFPDGAKVRVIGPHKFMGSEIRSGFRIGAVGTIKGNEPVRDFDTPHVVLEVSGSDSRKWIEIDCIELINDGGPTEDEVAVLFGLKTRTKLLSEVIAESAPYLSKKAVKELTKAIIDSPAWSKS